jgi:hypothetical protein
MDFKGLVRLEVSRLSIRAFFIFWHVLTSLMRSANFSWPPSTAHPGKLLPNPELVAVYGY